MNTQLAQNEESVIAAALIDPEAFENCNAIVESGDFYNQTHQWIWDVFTALHGQGSALDIVTVCNLLDQRGQLSEVGGVGFFARIMAYLPTSMHAEHYARIVAAQATRRRLMEAATSIAKLAMQEEDIPAAINQANQILSAVSKDKGGALHSQAQAVEEWYDSMADFIREGKITGLTTGYPKLDAKTGGLRRQELAIIAARPSMGKTSLASQMSIRQARHGLRVAVFTLEVTKRAWVEAAAVAELGIDKTRAKADDLPIIVEKCNELYALPMIYYERGQCTMDEIEHQSRLAYKALGGLDLIYVDHLGYINHMAGSGNLPYAIGQSTKRLAAISKTYDCAVVALCQLNRESARAGNEPQLVDLRDSGEIEQDGRQIWFIHRPGYYSDPAPADDKPQEARILVRKNHEGPTGKVSMAFVKSFRRFAEMI